MARTTKPKQPYTLVIIDMQVGFEAANYQDVIEGCAKEIKRARKAGMPIMLVEYDDFGDTQSALLNLVEGYRKCIVATKYDDDGSYEVGQWLKRKNWPSDNLRVCGVNAWCCVRETIWGLLCRDKHKNMRIKLVKSACGDMDFVDEDGVNGVTWKDYDKMTWYGKEQDLGPRLVLVP